MLHFFHLITHVKSKLGPWAPDALRVYCTARESITGHLVRPGNSSARGKLYKQVIYKCRRWSPASSNTVMSNEG